MSATWKNVIRDLKEKSRGQEKGRGRKAKQSGKGSLEEAVFKLKPEEG